MTFKLLIDGELVSGAATLDVIDPSSGEVFARCARADSSQLERAIAAAKRAFPGWSGQPYSERRVYIERLASALEARRDEFATLLTREQGKPLAQSQIELAGAIGILRYYAANADLRPVTIRDNEQERIIEQRIPLGVVAAIVPWNFPVFLLMLKVGPALSVGNTMIAKPAPSTPLTTALFGEIAAEILPAGVINTVVDCNDLGSELTQHPDVAKISFTGSTATGRRVMAGGAATLKRLTLELGGNDAAIVLDDVNVKEVAPKLFEAAMFNAGQLCVGAKRIYAPASLYDALCKELARLSREAVVDGGLKPGVQIGPLQNRQQFERVLELIEDARGQGEILAGGGALDRPGFFVAPTVICGLPDSARLVREEQFGPVMPVQSYATIDEAVERANDSEYGLGGTVWTSNVERGAAVAARINAGIVWVNRFFDLPFDVPVGGAKQSGIGREIGIEGMHQYTQAKILSVAKQAM
jgi:acyl-CoA reductase-like NAD-dependent aldehyde dehydrogenase